MQCREGVTVYVIYDGVFSTTERVIVEWKTI